MLTASEIIIDLHTSQTNQSSPTIWIICVALLLTIAANTLIGVKKYEKYKWWYGFLKVVAYFGMLAVTLSSAGLQAALASVSTYLGMEMSTFFRRLHDLGILNGFSHDTRSGQKDKESKDKAEREAAGQ